MNVKPPNTSFVTSLFRVQVSSFYRKNNVYKTKKVKFNIVLRFWNLQSLITHIKQLRQKFSVSWVVLKKNFPASPRHKQKKLLTEILAVFLLCRIWPGWGRLRR